MNRDNQELHDDQLVRLLRAELAGEHAPREWVREALAVARPAPRVVPSISRESWMRLLLPNLLGIALLVGLGLAAYLRPDVVNGIWSQARSVFSGWEFQPAGEGVGISQAWLALAVPAVILLVAEGWQGVSVLRRWLR